MHEEEKRLRAFYAKVIVRAYESVMQDQATTPKDKELMLFGKLRVDDWFEDVVEKVVRCSKISEHRPLHTSGPFSSEESLSAFALRELLVGVVAICGIGLRSESQRAMYEAELIPKIAKKSTEAARSATERSKLRSALDQIVPIVAEKYTKKYGKWDLSRRSKSGFAEKLLPEVNDALTKADLRPVKAGAIRNRDLSQFMTGESSD